MPLEFDKISRSITDFNPFCFCALKRNKYFLGNKRISEFFAI